MLSVMKLQLLAKAWQVFTTEILQAIKKAASQHPFLFSFYREKMFIFFLFPFLNSDYAVTVYFCLRQLGCLVLR